MGTLTHIKEMSQHSNHERYNKNTPSGTEAAQQPAQHSPAIEISKAYRGHGNHGHPHHITIDSEATAIAILILFCDSKRERESNNTKSKEYTYKLKRIIFKQMPQGSILAHLTSIKLANPERLRVHILGLKYKVLQKVDGSKGGKYT